MHFLLCSVRRTCCLLLLAATALLAATPPTAAAPLLQEGKKSLYQRVVSHPGATLLAEPKADAAVLTKAVTPFTVFYVYARQEGWLQVGVSVTQPQGWLEAAKTTAWNQSLTLLFTPRTGRDPVLFFSTRQALADLCAAPDMENRLAGLEKQAADLRARNAALPENLPIVPPNRRTLPGPSPKALLPHAYSGHADPYAGVKFLQVASIDPGTAGKTAQPPRPAQDGNRQVLDTSISMSRY
jgi:serine/threonine-protein kinase PpkA